MGLGTAGGGHLACTEKIRWVRSPHAPQKFIDILIECKNTLEKFDGPIAYQVKHLTFNQECQVRVLVGSQIFHDMELY